MPEEYNPRNWKSAQKSAIDEVEAELRRGFYKARAKWSLPGFIVPVEQGAFCFKCSCPQFLAKDPLDLELGAGSSIRSLRAGGECVGTIF